jgi:hypothetical protein
MQLFLLSKPPFLPVSDGKKLSTKLHYLGYALCSMLYVRLARWLLAGWWLVAAAPCSALDTSEHSARS